MILYFIVAYVLVLAPAAIQAAVSPSDSGPVPTAGEIMDRAVARVESQYQSFQEAFFESEATMKDEKLDSNGNPTETEITRYRQYPFGGAVFEELVEKNGRPLSQKELEEVEKQKTEFIREVEKRKARGDYLQPRKERAIRFDSHFASKYRYELLRTEQVREFTCWVIAFRPKEGKLPARDKMDHALNQLTGTIWIARDDYGLVRVEFAMRKPFKYWGGLLAVIRKTDGSVDYTRVAPDTWLPLHFNLQLDIRIMLVKNIRQHITKDWYNYRRAAQPEFTVQPQE